ncbi:Signal peptidase complex subunit 1 [Trichoplax sp. H2]|uniref:Signal peptidase complex subunit 1 n=1 Tax=Trichoplax adhaerens TaxID=10228 RepID=B3S097_TRIAD|nr:hypothetical protein TRIADDRAFT_57735 [Trichoplax adhaerens]EDV23972.1 hypothetical protein TRIADDRAFT_57735 [Trichoplax adhaerens]RDD36812.1 Signal peptidase complex subunit 1 [Trichoplax sp. H2]|eukprot:XP_002113498.1 hypothetical protein TRIADDRAFT_57735 [Trichoplax adhaerens]
MLEDLVVSLFPFPGIKNRIFMDYEGQKLAEFVMQAIILIFAGIGLLFGYYYDTFRVTMMVYGAGVALATIVTVPPWPIYRSHPLRWQTPKVSTDIKSPKEKKSKSKGRK